MQMFLLVEKGCKRKDPGRQVVPHKWFFFVQDKGVDLSTKTVGSVRES
jgi:hypothetical protein